MANQIVANDHWNVCTLGKKSAQQIVFTNKHQEGLESCRQVAQNAAKRSPYMNGQAIRWLGETEISYTWRATIYLQKNRSLEF